VCVCVGLRETIIKRSSECRRRGILPTVAAPRSAGRPRDEHGAKRGLLRLVLLLLLMLFLRRWNSLHRDLISSTASFGASIVVAHRGRRSLGRRNWNNPCQLIELLPLNFVAAHSPDRRACEVIYELGHQQAANGWWRQRLANERTNQPTNEGRRHNTTIRPLEMDGERACQTNRAKWGIQLSYKAQAAPPPANGAERVQRRRRTSRAR
jgi:hypothetical protein